MVGHEATGRSYAHVGVKEPHHSTSHHKNTPESLEQYARIGAYHMPLAMIHFVPGTATRSSGFLSPQTNSRPPLGLQPSSAALADPAPPTTITNTTSPTRVFISMLQIGS